MIVKKKDVQLFWLVILCELISASVILIMPEENAKKNLVALAGMTFWFFLLTGYLLLLQINIRRKRLIKKEKLSRLQKRWGIITFFSNSKAKLFDVLFLLSLLTFFAPSLFDKDFGKIMRIPLFLLVFSFHMHCIFNGMNYKYIVFLRERGRRHEKK